MEAAASMMEAAAKCVFLPEMRGFGLQILVTVGTQINQCVTNNVV